MQHCIFKLKDKTGKEIHLSKERWKHIRTEHSEITDTEEIEQALTKPVKILLSDRDPDVRWYFLYKKNKKRYLKVSVKYLNGEG